MTGVSRALGEVLSGHPLSRYLLGTRQFFVTGARPTSSPIFYSPSPARHRPRLAGAAPSRSRAVFCTALSFPAAIGCNILLWGYFLFVVVNFCKADATLKQLAKLFIFAIKIIVLKAY